jgi:hypothetical protein
MSRDRASLLLRLLWKLPDDSRRALAKSVFFCAGWLTRVKTYQRYYSMDNLDDLGSDEPLKFTLEGRHWASCEWSMSLLNFSMQLDWDHWDHWACMHEDCDPFPCTVCGGLACRNEEE